MLLSFTDYPDIGVMQPFFYLLNCLATIERISEGSWIRRYPEKSQYDYPGEADRFLSS